MPNAIPRGGVIARWPAEKVGSGVDVARQLKAGLRAEKENLGFKSANFLLCLGGSGYVSSQEGNMYWMILDSYSWSKKSCTTWDIRKTPTK